MFLGDQTRHVKFFYPFTGEGVQELENLDEGKGLMEANFFSIFRHCFHYLNPQLL